MKQSFATKLLTLLLCVATLATVTPLFAVAETTITEITITDADLTPYALEKSGDWLRYTIPENCHFIQERHYWYDESVESPMEESDMFWRGQEYSLCWMFEAESGYTFAEDATVTINGLTSVIDQDNTGRHGGFPTYFCVWTKPVESTETYAANHIDKIEISNADVVPYIDEKVGDWLDYAVPDKRHFMVGNHYWYNETIGHIMEPDEVFEEGAKYSLCWMLEADSDWEFAADATVTVNDSTSVINWEYTGRDGNVPKLFPVWTNPVTAVKKPDTTVITEIDIAGVDTVPYIGEEASSHLNYMLPENCHYTVDSLYWYDEETGYHLPGDTVVFEAEKSYSRRWNLTADKGYVFAEDAAVTINGSAVLVDTGYTKIDTYNEAEFVVWMLPIEATEAEPTATEPEPTATATEPTATEAESTATATETTATEPEPTATEAEPTATATETTATATETTATEAESTATVTEAEPTATEPSATATEPVIEPTTTGTETPIAFLGDANNDGAVNMKDVLTLRKMLAGMEVSYNAANADVNGDGDVNMKDVLMLRKFLAGLITELGA